MVHVDEMAMPKELCMGNIDAVAVLAAQPSAVIQNVLDSCDVQFIDIPKSTTSQIAQQYDCYFEKDITTQTFNKPGKAVNTFATRAILFTNSYVTKEKVEIVRMLVGNHLDEFKGAYQVLQNLDPYTLRDNKEFIDYEW